MPLAAGKLRHWIAIKAVTRDSNPYGERKPVLSVLAETWASVEPVSGRELWQAAQVDAQVSHRVRTRYLPGVTAECVVEHEGRTLNVIFVRDVEERHELLEIYCLEAS